MLISVRSMNPEDQPPVQPTAASANAESTLAEDREDARLIRATAAGEERALALLYQRRGGLIYGFLMRMLGREDEAREVLQDTFVRLWRRAGEFDPERASATAWLLQFARGLALDRLRSRSRHAAKLEAYGQEVATLTTPVGPVTGQAELETACQQALQKLPGPQAEALQLAFFRGWTHEQIATAQGEALGTVKARIRRGLLALRQTLREYYD
jgi:RNA polymerase sigma-70 factor (ECF subfamily)